METGQARVLHVIAAHSSGKGTDVLLVSKFWTLHPVLLRDTLFCVNGSPWGPESVEVRTRRAMPTFLLLALL